MRIQAGRDIHHPTRTHPLEIVRHFAELIPFLAPYPNWVKMLVAVWTLLTATLLLSLLFARGNLPPAEEFSLSGRVVSGEQVGLGSVNVELTLGSSHYQGTTDSEGDFRIPTNPPGKTVGIRIRIAAAGYRPYDRILQISDTTRDLGVFKLVVENPPASRTTPSPLEALRQQREELLLPPRDISDRYSSLATTGRGGVVKLLSSRVAEANREILPNGGGTYYSFLRRTHEYGHGSDIQFESGGFSTGFAGLDYGYFLNLGGVPFENLEAATEDPPSWLPTQRRGAWSYLWNYVPPNVTAEVRRHQRSARSQVVDGVSISERAAPAVGNSYLLRSIGYRESDLLVGFRVERVTDDGSIVLVWRILKTFDTPVAEGPEPDE